MEYFSSPESVALFWDFFFLIDIYRKRDDRYTGGVEKKNPDKCLAEIEAERERHK